MVEVGAAVIGKQGRFVVSAKFDVFACEQVSICSEMASTGDLPLGTTISSSGFSDRPASSLTSSSLHFATRFALGAPAAEGTCFKCRKRIDDDESTNAPHTSGAYVPSSHRDWGSRPCWLSSRISQLDPTEANKGVENKLEMRTHTAAARVLVTISIGNLRGADDLIQKSVGQFRGGQSRDSYRQSIFDLCLVVDWLDLITQFSKGRWGNIRCERTSSPSRAK